MQLIPVLKIGWKKKKSTILNHLRKKDSSDTITTEMEKDSLAISIVKTIVLLGLILFLIYFLLKLLNKKNRLFQQSKTLENLGGISLGQNKSIQVIRVGEKNVFNRCW